MLKLKGTHRILIRERVGGQSVLKYVVPFAECFPSIGGVGLRQVVVCGRIACHPPLDTILNTKASARVHLFKMRHTRATGGFYSELLWMWTLQWMSNFMCAGWDFSWEE